MGFSKKETQGAFPIIGRGTDRRDSCWPRSRGSFSPSRFWPPDGRTAFGLEDELVCMGHWLARSPRGRWGSRSPDSGGFMAPRAREEDRVRPADRDRAGLAKDAVG